MNRNRLAGRKEDDRPNQAITIALADSVARAAESRALPMRIRPFEPSQAREDVAIVAKPLPCAPVRRRFPEKIEEDFGRAQARPGFAVQARLVNPRGREEGAPEPHDEALFAARPWSMRGKCMEPPGFRLSHGCRAPARRDQRLYMPGGRTPPRLLVIGLLRRRESIDDAGDDVGRVNRLPILLVAALRDATLRRTSDRPS